MEGLSAGARPAAHSRSYRDPASGVETEGEALAFNKTDGIRPYSLGALGVPNYPEAQLQTFMAPNNDMIRRMAIQTGSAERYVLGQAITPLPSGYDAYAVDMAAYRTSLIGSLHNPGWGGMIPIAGGYANFDYYLSRWAISGNVSDGLQAELGLFQFVGDVFTAGTLGSAAFDIGRGVSLAPSVSVLRTTFIGARPADAIGLIDPQLDTNLLVRLSQGDPVVVTYAVKNRAAGLSYNLSTRFEFLAGGSRAELRLLEQQYDIRLLREIPTPQLQATATRLRAAFNDGRVLGYWDSQVAASAYLRGERLATGDLQFFKRASDLGLDVEFVGTGNAAARAGAYVPRPVAVPP